MYFSDKSSPQRLDISQTHNKGHFFPVGKLEEKTSVQESCVWDDRAKERAAGKKLQGQPTPVPGG